MNENHKKREKRIQKKLKQDVKKLEKDWKRLFKHHSLSKNIPFLEEFSSDIKTLHDDALALEKNEPIAYIVDQFVTQKLEDPTPFDFTLLDASLSFSYQKPLDSDLCTLLTHMTESPKNKNLATLFWVLAEEIS